MTVALFALSEAKTTCPHGCCHLSAKPITAGVKRLNYASGLFSENNNED